MTRRRAKMKIRRGVETVGRDGHGQELMRLGGRWMANTEREMRERLGLLSTFRLRNIRHPEILKAWLIHENSCF